MMTALQPSAVACCTASSFNPTCTGDGIKAGLMAGASKDKDAAPMVFDRGAVAPGVDAGYEGEGEGAIFRGSILPGEYRQPALHEGESPRPALRQRVHPL